ncbi:MAG TPA: hypothetical protein VHO69_00090 [Phototrophicaceae bacterium]|nr:hypothetical protein [Phototrophicaceae bacterium]
MTYPDDYQPVGQRRRILRIVLFVIILGTLPFYCLGTALLVTAPRNNSARQTSVPATMTPIQNVRPTNTPFPTLGVRATVTQFSPLKPTPLQYNPGSGIPIYPTATPFYVPPPTVVIIPTNTTAPTLTPLPTQVPPTWTLLPTWTPLPTDPPLPTATNTEAPPPTEAVVPPATEAAAPGA